MKYSKVIFLVMMLCVLNLAFSQTWDQAKGVGVSVAALKPYGGMSDQASLAFPVGLNLSYAPSPFVMLGLDLNHGSFKPVLDGSNWEPDDEAPYRTFIVPLNLTVKVTPAEDSRWKPYVLYSAGLMLWDLRDVSGVEDSFMDAQDWRWGDPVSDLQTEIALGLGLGIEYFLADFLAFDLGVRHISLLNQDKDNVGYGNDANDKTLEARLSLRYYWGMNKDSDKDGIKDKVDAAPFEPEDFDGFQDEDGAPDPDNDNDGVLDVNDKAPLVPEDLDGFQDDDGVPDPDNDNDGVLDVNDKAPLDPEDLDGFQDDDGVPDPDNDNDGILDADDDCPNEAETFNGYQDEDGCPDKKPMPKLEKKGAKLTLEGVNFESGSASLTQDSYQILDKVAAGLVDHPEVNIEIRGYTDSVGPASVNKNLSQKRADSVKQYLVDQGVEADRLKAVGYGEESPVAPNNTAEGRAKNRRIEFYRSN
mgnify:CR=1 FL=1